MELLAKIICTIMLLKSLLLLFAPSYFEQRENWLRSILAKSYYPLLLLVISVSVFLFSRFTSSEILVHWIVSVWSIVVFLAAVVVYFKPAIFINAYLALMEDLKLRLITSSAFLLLSVLLLLLI